MKDLVPFLVDIQNGNAGDRPGVIGLSAGCRVECGLAQSNQVTTGFLPSLNDASGKLQEVGVFEKQSV